VSFEKAEQEEQKRPDRRLGDEWTDWDGTLQQNDTRTSPWAFIGLAALCTVLFGVLGWGLLWLIAPRLQSVGSALIPRVVLWIWFGYLAAWLLTLVLGFSGVSFLKKVLRLLGGIRWIVGPVVIVGKIFGLSRDRIGHAFILIYNRFEVLPPLIKDPLKLLLLVPRCVSRENMVQLRGLKERYGISQVVALGGTEARKAIAQIRPKGIVAIACERDLLVGIKDLRGRIPVLSFTNQRPEGPCKNTLVDIEAIERAIHVFLGNPTDETVENKAEGGKS
jgi:uncharacterized protein